MTYTDPRGTVVQRVFSVLPDKTAELYSSITALFAAYADQMTERETESIALAIVHRYGPNPQLSPAGAQSSKTEPRSLDPERT